MYGVQYSFFSCPFQFSPLHGFTPPNPWNLITIRVYLRDGRIIVIRNRGVELISVEHAQRRGILSSLATIELDLSSERPTVYNN